MQPHEILEGGARQIEDKGLCKGSFGWGSNGHCMMGAMRVAVHGCTSYPVSLEYVAALEELSKVCSAEFPFLHEDLLFLGDGEDSAFGRVALCNDSDDMAQHQAIALMEKAAANLRP